MTRWPSDTGRRSSGRRLRCLAASLALLAVATGCRSSGTQASATVTVFAAASLTEAFGRIGEAFEAANPGVDVEFNFAGSSTLATQLTQGAPADVFVAADSTTMSKALDRRPADGRHVIVATNELAVVVEAGNPRRITSLGDLADPSLIVVLAAPQVPAGRYAAQVLRNAGIEVSPRSLEIDVKAVVAKVARGEADAGIAYATDVVAAGGTVTGVPIPNELNVRAEYPAVVLADAPNAAGATAFLDFVRGPSGRATLAAYGFVLP